MTPADEPLPLSSAEDTVGPTLESFTPSPDGLVVGPLAAPKPVASGMSMAEWFSLAGIATLMMGLVTNVETRSATGASRTARLERTARQERLAAEIAALKLELDPADIASAKMDLSDDECNGK